MHAENKIKVIEKNIISIPVFHFSLLLFFISFFTTTYGQSWTQVAGIDSVTVFSIAEQDNNLFVVTPTDVYIGKEKGSSWTKTQSIPESNSYFYTIYSYQGNLYLGTYADGVFISSDSGENWQKINTGLSQAALGIVEFAGRGDSLFAATDNDGIYYLNLLQAPSWKKFNSGLFQFGSGSIYSSGDILLANLGMYLFMNNKNRSDWQNIFVDTTETQRQFYDFISHDNFIFAGTNNGIYRGNLSAENWERKDIQVFQGRDISAFASYGSRLYAGLIFGEQHWIFSTDDSGNSWEIRAHEFSWLYDLLVFEEKLWAAREDGLWFIDISGTTGIENPDESIPVNFVLHQNYPNPFNPVTKIEYFLASTSFVTLKIFDALGREVQTLVEEEKQKGTHNIEFNANGLSSGIYFYQIKSGNFIQTNKMILLK